MKEKMLFVELLKFLSLSPGERILITRDVAEGLQGRSLYDLTVPFTFVIYGDGLAVPFILHLDFGRVPKGVVSLLSAKSPFVNSHEIEVTGNKMPDVKIKIKIEQ